MKQDQKETITDIKEYLESQIPGVKNFISDLGRSIGPSVINIFQEFHKNDPDILGELFNFKLKVVIDNNILFAEIYGLIKGGKEVENSFLYGLATNPAIEIYAPPFLKIEIFDKISKKIKWGKKTKAKEFALKLLKLFRIQDAKWVEDWQRAKRKIGHRDQDDIPYLALCFDLKGHGIISDDKIFAEEQEEIKSWKLKEVGKISSEINEGMISFYIFGKIPTLAKLIHDFLSVIFVTIIDQVKYFLSILYGIMREGISYLSKIPPYILIIIGGLALFAYFGIKEVQKGVNESLKKMQDYITTLIKNLKKWINNFIQFIKRIYEIITPFFKYTFFFFSYLAFNADQVMQMIYELENN